MNRTGEPTVEELMARIAALEAENRQLTERVVKLEEELALARLHRFAPKSEKHIDRLFNEAEQAADEDDADGEDDDVADLPDTGLPVVDSAPGKKRGRRPLPENLPRERVEYDLPDDQKACPCCRNQMHRMGETITEQLHIEVKAKVLQNVRFKYACRHCDRTGINTPIAIAPMPAQPLPGSIATASTLAFSLVHKYVDGTPLYRLAQAFERAGVPVSRGALGHWVIGSSEKHLCRIYDALKLRLRLQSLIHGDETTVQVLKEKDRKATDESYMWAWVIASAQLPSDEDDTPAAAQLVLENLDAEMVRLVRSFTDIATAHIAVVLAGTPNLIEDEYTDLQILSADIDASQIALSLGREEIELEYFPSGRMSRDRFPGLFL